MIKNCTTKILYFLLVDILILSGCTPLSNLSETAKKSQISAPKESAEVHNPPTELPELSPLHVNFHEEELNLYHKNNWSIEYAGKWSRDVLVKKKNMLNQTEDTIISYSEYWTDNFSVFIPPSVARSPGGNQYLYSTATEFLLWTPATDETICLANVLEKKSLLDSPPGDSQTWQYHYSSEYSNPIWGVYAPRYPKWSFDGRYCSIDVPIYREGSGSFVFDIQNMDTIPIGDSIHTFIGSGIDIQWSPVANQFVSSTASTGWNDKQFVISHLENGALEDMTEILPQNFQETYNAIFSPDGARIAFLGISSSPSFLYQPTLYEFHLQNHTLTKIYTLMEDHYSNQFPFFYSPDGQMLFYATRLNNTWTLFRYHLKTKITEKIAIWASPEKSDETHLVDWFWHKDTVFLTFYLEKARQSEPSSSKVQIRSQIFGIQPDERKLYYRSDWYKGKVKILDIQTH